MNEQLQLVLDACCGPRMFWFTKDDDRVLFVDKREEDHDLSGNGWKRAFSIRPDVVADFTNLPFSSNRFRLVVFDPPHITRVNQSHGFMVKKYGYLAPGWREMIRGGFAECFRVLEMGGVLIFKWSETDVSTKEVLKLTDQRPLFGSRIGKYNRTHWIVFMKRDAAELRCQERTEPDAPDVNSRVAPSGEESVRTVSGTTATIASGMAYDSSSGDARTAALDAIQKVLEGHRFEDSTCSCGWSPDTPEMARGAWKCWAQHVREEAEKELAR